MPRVLVTGMSGTGKSTALQILGQRGHRVVDTDTDQWSHWVSSPDGSPDWIWREEAINRLLASPQHDHLFVAGCKTNQGKFYRQFDHIALLSAPAEVLLARISARDSNPYGKRPEERGGRAVSWVTRAGGRLAECGWVGKLGAGGVQVGLGAFGAGS